MVNPISCDYDDLWEVSDGDFWNGVAGGGARGAYTAGTLRYLYTELPKKLGYQPWPKVVSGTSAGALNGYFAASQSMMEVHRCTALWTNFTVEQVYRLPFEGWLKLIPDLRNAAQRASFLDPTPLGKLIEREAARRTIRHSIGSGACLLSSYPLRNSTVETTFSSSILQTLTFRFLRRHTEDWFTTNSILNT